MSELSLVSVSDFGDDYGSDYSDMNDYSFEEWIESIESELVQAAQTLLQDPVRFEVSVDLLRRKVINGTPLQILDDLGFFYHHDCVQRFYQRDERNKAYCLLLAYRLMWPDPRDLTLWREVEEEIVKVVDQIRSMVCEFNCDYYEDPNDWNRSHLACGYWANLVSYFMMESWLAYRGVPPLDIPRLMGGNFDGHPWKFDADYDYRRYLDKIISGDDCINRRPFCKPWSDKDHREPPCAPVLTVCSAEIDEITQMIEELGVSPSRKMTKVYRKMTKIDRNKAERRLRSKLLRKKVQKEVACVKRNQIDEKLYPTALLESIKKGVKVAGIHLSAWCKTAQVMLGTDKSNPLTERFTQCLISQFVLCIDSLYADCSLRNVVRQIGSLMNVCHYPFTQALIDIWELIKPFIGECANFIFEKWENVKDYFSSPAPGSPQQQREGARLTPLRTEEDVAVDQFVSRLTNSDFITSVSAIIAGASVIIASVILGKQSVKDMPDAASWVDKLSKAAKAISSAKTGLYAILQMMKDFMAWVRQVVEGYFFQYGTNALLYALVNSDIEDTEHLKKEKILEYIVELTDPGNKDFVLTRNDFRDKLDFCLVVCQDLTKRICEGKVKLDKVAIDKHSQLLVELKKLKHFACKRTPEGYFRITPFWIYLYGPAGTGKSVLMPKLADCILQTLRPFAAEFGIPSEDRWKYAVNFADKHLNNYTQEYCVLIDDVFQDKEGYLETSSAIKLIQWVSCIPHTTEQASIEDKGLYFNSKIVISSSNIRGDTIERMEVLDQEALRRRMSLLVRVDFKQGWQDPDLQRGVAVFLNDQPILFRDLIVKATREFVNHYRHQKRLAETRSAPEDIVNHVREQLQDILYPERLIPTMAQEDEDEDWEGPTIEEVEEDETPGFMVPPVHHRPRRNIRVEVQDQNSWSDKIWRFLTAYHFRTWLYDFLMNYVYDSTVQPLEFDQEKFFSDTPEGLYYSIQVGLDYKILRIVNKRIKVSSSDGSVAATKIIPMVAIRDQDLQRFLQVAFPNTNQGEILGRFLSIVDTFNEWQVNFAYNLIKNGESAPNATMPDPCDFYQDFRPETYNLKAGHINDEWRAFMDQFRAMKDSVWEFFSNHWIPKAFMAALTIKLGYDLYKIWTAKPATDQPQPPTGRDLNDLAQDHIIPASLKYEFAKPARARGPKVIKLNPTRQECDLPVSIEGFDYYSDKPDDNAYAVANSLISHGATCILRCKPTGAEGRTPTFKAHCLRIGGTAILANHHAFWNMKDGDYLEVEVPNWKQGARIVPQIFERKRLYRIGQKDLAVYKCDNALPPARNILNHFPDTSIKRQGTQAVILSTSQQISNLEALPVSPAISYVGDDGVPYDMGAVYTVDYPMRQGMSGSPLIAVNNNITKKIIGIATATSDHGYSYFTIVSQPELVDAFRQLDIKDNFVQETELVACSLQCFDRNCPEEISKNSLEFIGGIPQALAVVPPDNTKLRKSLIHDPEKATMGPSVLSPRDPRMKPELQGKSVLLRNMAGYDRKYGAVDNSLLDRVKEDMGHEYKYKMDKKNIPRRLLTDFETVNGLKGDLLKPIEMDTSPGYPFIKQRKNTNKNGKYEWFDEHIGEDGSKLYTMRSDLQDGFDRQDAAIRKGEIPSEWIGYVCLKDEKRSKEKILNGVTRTFICLPMTYNLLIRKYFGMFIATQHARAGMDASSVGVDPATGWSRIYFRLSEYADEWEDFDYKQWDQSLHPAFFDAYAHLVSKWYGDEPDSPEYLARMSLMKFLCHTPLIGGKMLFRKGGGQCSGCAITAEINCVIHDMLMYYAWLKICRQHGKIEEMNLDTYRSQVALAVYGDDIILAVRPEYQDLFNGSNIRVVTEELGMQITAADKTLNFKRKPKHQVTFLKRRFIAADWDPLTILCPLDRKVIEEIPQWIHKSDDELSATLTNCEMALREAYWHGKQYYNQLRDDLCERLRVATSGRGMKNATISLSYESLHEEHLRGLLRTVNSYYSVRPETSDDDNATPE